MQVKRILVPFFGYIRAVLTIITVSLGLLFATAADNLPDNPAEKLNVKKGMASYYHNSFVGKKTASGEVFTQQKLTCASNQYPLGTWLRVTNLRNGKTVIVKVNDRMHPRMKRVVDLTELAAKEIGMIKSGIAQVQVENLGKIPPKESAQVKSL